MSQLKGTEYKRLSRPPEKFLLLGTILAGQEITPARN